MKCNGKVAFRTKREAEEFIEYGVTDGQNMVAYLCSVHKCWHIGHPKPYEENPPNRVQLLIDELNQNSED